MKLLIQNHMLFFIQGYLDYIGLNSSETTAYPWLTLNLNTTMFSKILRTNTSMSSTKSSSAQSSAIIIIYIMATLTIFTMILEVFFVTIFLCKSRGATYNPVDKTLNQGISNQHENIDQIYSRTYIAAEHNTPSLIVEALSHSISTGENGLLGSVLSHTSHTGDTDREIDRELTEHFLTNVEVHRRTDELIQCVQTQQSNHSNNYIPA